MADEQTPDSKTDLNGEGDKTQKTEGDKQKKVTFDTEQQAAINKIYNEAYKAGAEKVEAEKVAKLAAEKAALEAEKADLAAKLAAITPKPEDKDKSAPELEQFKAQMQEMREILGTIKTERDTLKAQVENEQKERRKSKKKELFLDAASKAKINFFDPLEAYKLAEDDGYEFDAATEAPVIKNKATGAPRLNENGEHMSPLDFVKDFAKRKNYLVQAKDAGGTNSGEQRQQEKGNKDETVDYSKMTNEEFEAIRQRALAAQPKNR